jgi:ferrous iron transport protein A
MAINLSFADLKQGAKARVVKMEPTSVLLQRLMEMGLMEGTEFEVLKVAPLGDPVEIAFRSQRLCLRKAEAAGIVVTPI